MKKRRRIDTPVSKSGRVASRLAKEAAAKKRKEEAAQKHSAHLRVAAHPQVLPVGDLPVGVAPYSEETYKKAAWAFNLLNSGIVMPGGSVRNKHGVFSYDELRDLASLHDPKRT